jgi:hypothetical protein
VQLTPANAVSQLFLRVPEAQRSCSIDGIDMTSQPHIVFASLARFIAEEVREGRGGLDSAIDRVGAFVEELAATGDPELESIVCFAYIHGLRADLGSCAVDLSSLGPETRRLFARLRP